MCLVGRADNAHMSATHTLSAPAAKVFARLLDTFVNVDYVTEADRRFICGTASSEARGEALVVAAEFYGRPLYEVIDAARGQLNTARVVG